MIVCIKLYRQKQSVTAYKGKAISCGLVMPYHNKYIHCFPDNNRSCKDMCKIRRCWYIPDYTWRCRL